MKLVISDVMLVEPAADFELAFVVLVAAVIELLSEAPVVPVPEAESTFMLQAEKMVDDTIKNKISFFISLMLRLYLRLILKKLITKCKTLFSAYKTLISIYSILLRVFSYRLRFLLICI